MANYKGEDRREFHSTPYELIEEMFNLLDKYYEGEITELLESGAGDGRIMDKFIERYNKPAIGFDIVKMRDDLNIKECDYLKEKLEYKTGRVAVINPNFAYGIKNVYKTLEECDYTIALLSYNSLLNIDYSKYWLEECQLWRKVDFGSCKVSIILIAIRKKKEGELYEYE